MAAKRQRKMRGPVRSVEPVAPEVEPTPEWMAKGEVIPVRAAGERWTDRPVMTVRRRQYDAIRHLESRGVLDEKQAEAFRWMRDLYEIAQLGRTQGVASYGDHVKELAHYGHMPTSERAAAARAAYRTMCEHIPDRASKPVLKVVIDNVPPTRAALLINRRYTHVRKMLVLAADALVAYLADFGLRVRAEIAND